MRCWNTCSLTPRIMPTTASRGSILATIGRSISALSDFSRGRRAFLAQPASDKDDAWVPDHLDYQFAVSAPMPDGTEKVYVADDYASNRLDWYSVDLDPSITTLGDVAGSGTTGLPPDAPFTTIPIPVSFSGMPNTRWWAFEDHATNFGNIDASTTDLAKLLFMEFALVYSNDWFVIPCTLAVRGTGASAWHCSYQRLRRAALDWAGRRRSRGRLGPLEHVYRQHSQRSGRKRSRSYACIASHARQCSQRVQPMEEVFLVRDEVANMAWGVETTVALASGISRPGGEVAIQTFNYLQGLIPPGLDPSSDDRACSLSGDELGAGELDSVHSRACAQQQSRDPIAARRHATNSGRRPKYSAKGAAADFAAAAGTGSHFCPAIFHSRGRGASRRSPALAVLLARSLDAGPGLHLAACPQANRPWRSL